MKATDLCALVSSRLCHDLVSPVGAISNGLEILAEEDDPEVIRQAVELLTFSAGQAERKLQFYRLAFGAGSAAGGHMESEEVERLIRRFLEQDGIAFQWTGRPEKLSRIEARIIANLILIGMDCLPRKGTLRLDTGDASLSLVASGEGCRLRDAFAEVLSGSPQEPTPHVAPGALLKALIEEAGGHLVTEQSGADVRFFVVGG